MNVIEWLMSKSAADVEPFSNDFDESGGGNTMKYPNEGSKPVVEGIGRMIHSYVPSFMGGMDDKEYDDFVNPERDKYQEYTVEGTDRDRKWNANIQRYGNRTDAGGKSLLAGHEIDPNTGDVQPRLAQYLPENTRKRAAEAAKRNLENKMPSSIAQKIPEREDPDDAIEGKDYVKSEFGSRIWL